MTKENVIPQPITNLLRNLRILRNLGKSPAFAMSRGGRELFHTNFLAFILEEKSSENEYLNAFKKHIIYAFFGSESKVSKVRALREKSNLDLILIPEITADSIQNFEIVIVEAKIKAIPNNEQLIKYNLKLTNGLGVEFDDDNTPKIKLDNQQRPPVQIEYEPTSIVITLEDTKQPNGKLQLIDKRYLRKERAKKIDISIKRYMLAPTTISKGIDKDLNWGLVDWSDLLKKFEVKRSNDDKSLKSMLLEDYLSSTKQLIKLADYSALKAESFVKSEVNFQDILQHYNCKKFRELRVHDLVGKVIYHQLQLKLAEDIVKCEKLKSVMSKLESSYSFSFFSHSFYTRSTPGFEIGFKCVVQPNHGNKEKLVGIGVQIQGDFYRHFLKRENYENPTNPLINCAGNLKKWIESVDANVEHTEFKKYDETKFLYLDSKLTMETYSELRDKIIDSLISLETNLDEKFVTDLKAENLSNVAI